MQKLLRLFLAVLVASSLMVSVGFAGESYPEGGCYPPDGLPGGCDGAY